MPTMGWRRVAYIDETHNEDSYWICGLVVDVGNVIPTQEALMAVATDAAAAYGLENVPELHGYDLFTREGAFERVPPRACISVYADAIDEIVAAEPSVVLRGVRRAKIRLQNPHRLAFRYAIESIDELRGDGPILIVADEHSETEQAIRRDVQSYVTYDTGGWKPRSLEKVLPELKFVDSRSNPLLQAADLIAYLHQRRFNIETEADGRSQAAREMLWAKVTPLVAVTRIWEPTS
jgi:hypothetical protein